MSSRQNAHDRQESKKGESTLEFQGQRLRGIAKKIVLFLKKTRKLNNPIFRGQKMLWNYKMTLEKNPLLVNGILVQKKVVVLTKILKGKKRQEKELEKEREIELVC